MADIRAQILEATREVLEKEGMKGATTREIARAAGCAEGTLFNHFGNREGLFLALFVDTLPTFRVALGELTLRVGESDVAETLSGVLSAGLGFFRRVMPLFTGLVSDPALLSAYRSRLKAEGRGPHRAFDVISAYLRAEQRIGRVTPRLDVDVAAPTIVGACFFRAFYERFMGMPVDAEADAAWCAAFLETTCATWFVAPVAPEKKGADRRAPSRRRRL